MKTKIITILFLFTLSIVSAQNITGSSTTNYVLKFTNTSTVSPTAGNSSIFDNGKVGIGTTNPTGLLHNHSSNTDNRLYLTNSISGTSISDGLLFQLDNSTAYIWNFENGPLRFGTSNTSVIYIESTGDVGIGTTSPSAKLDLVGTFQYTDGNQGSGKVLTSDASGNATWENPDNVVRLISRTTNVDFKSTGTTSLYTVPAGKNLMITQIVVIGSNVSNITAQNSQKVGSNSPNFDNWGYSLGSPGSTGNYSMHSASSASNGKIFTAGEVITVKYTANTATNDVVTIDVIGYTF